MNYYNLMKCSVPATLLTVLLSTVFFLGLEAQDSTLKRPHVTDNMKDYSLQVKKDPGKQMIEIRSAIPDAKYDLRYASVNNFMHRRMYPENTQVSYLRRATMDALIKAAKVFRDSGYGIRIFDAYRPFSVTVQFWDLVKDERYVANPSKGSGHNRGIAIDLTLYNLSTGKDLNMGTDFDNFTDSAHQDFTKLDAMVLRNRKLLRSVMEASGFKALETEWWHYSLPGSERFEVLDLAFKKLSGR